MRVLFAPVNEAMTGIYLMSLILRYSVKGERATSLVTGSSLWWQALMEVNKGSVAFKMTLVLSLPGHRGRM